MLRGCPRLGEGAEAASNLDVAPGEPEAQVTHVKAPAETARTHS